jgi:trk system potassium uptake protein TrkA
MRVVIIGAGEVGTAIASNLAGEHDVVVIELDEERAEQLKYELDVLTLAGDGTSMERLETAEVAEADILLACTDDDRANLVACGTAKALADPFTIARVKNVEYLRTWERDNEAFGAEFVVCSDLLTAENIVRVIGLPAAVDVDTFVSGLVHMAVFEITRSSPVAGQSVMEADRFDSLTFAGLFRNGDLLVASGDTVIEAGDRAAVIGSSESVQQFAADIISEATPNTADEIVVVGGSDIGYHTARLLEERRFTPRLVEEDPDQARYLAEELPGTTVMQHDPSDTEFLQQEHIDEAEVLVVALESDEKCLLVSVLARRLGVDRIVAVVETAEYVTIFEEIGIDVAINPRRATAEEITRFSFESVAENLAVLENDQAEVLELQLGADSGLVGTPIQELDANIEGQFVVGAIARGRSLITPRGDTVLRPGDHIVIFAETEAVGGITALA